MTDHATRQHLLALERRAITQSAAIRDLTQRVERELGGALAAALKRIERLEESLRAMVAGRLAKLTHGGDRSKSPIGDLTTQAGAAAMLNVSVPAARAAEVLGCDVRTVRRLVESGALRGDSRRLAGRRRHWSVSTADLERLISKGGSPAAPAASKGEIPGARRSGAKG